jgi:hypothetical protein
MAFIKIDRNFFEGKYWKQKRVFSQAEAWIDLVRTARFEIEPETRILSSGRYITIKRGEIHASIRFLAERWSWGTDKVKRFLDAAISEQAIERRTEQGESIITLLNYGIYNPTDDESQTPNRTPNRTPIDTPTEHPSIHQPNTNKYKLKNIRTKEDKNNIVGVKKTPATLHTVCKNLFIEKFRQLFGEEYYWEAKDGANLNPIIKKIKFNREKKEMPIDDESISIAFSLFLDSITDKWLLENFSISNINSKFNEIISQAKNGRTKQQCNQPTSAELSAAVEIGMALAEADKRR